MRSPRLTTRQLMALVALAALVLAGLHGGPRPGLYYTLGDRCFGVCRNDLLGRSLGHDGEPMGRVYQFGGWPAGCSEVVRTGLYVRDGQLYGQLRGRNLVLW
jgi:hypothetical protein